MVEIKIILKSGSRLDYRSKQINMTENLIRLITDDNTGVGIPMSNIEYWEVTDIGELK